MTNARIFCLTTHLHKNSRPVAIHPDGSIQERLHRENYAAIVSCAPAHGKRHVSNGGPANKVDQTDYSMGAMPVHPRKRVASLRGFALGRPINFLMFIIAHNTLAPTRELGQRAHGGAACGAISAESK